MCEQLYTSHTRRVVSDLSRFSVSEGIAASCPRAHSRASAQRVPKPTSQQKLEKRSSKLQHRDAVLILFRLSGGFRVSFSKAAWTSHLAAVKELILLFTSLLAVPLACQGCLDTFLFAGLQVVGVTLHFLDDVLLLHLPLESAQSIFQRFAFLNANLRQK